MSPLTGWWRPAVVLAGLVLVPLAVTLTSAWVLWRLGGVFAVLTAVALVAMTHIARNLWEATP